MFFIKHETTTRPLRSTFAALRLSAAFLAIGIFAAACSQDVPNAAAIDKPSIEALSKTVLEGADNTEVIVSRVAIPANMALPKHWHPGEEFGYVIEGQVTLHLEGEADQVVEAGQPLTVPFAHVHSATAGPDGVVAVIFRVHETGKPERVLVE